MFDLTSRAENKRNRKKTTRRKKVRTSAGEMGQIFAEAAGALLSKTRKSREIAQSKSEPRNLTNQKDVMATHKTANADF